MWGERGKFLWIAQKHTGNTSCILSMVSAKLSYAMPLSTHGATGTGCARFPKVIIEFISLMHYSKKEFMCGRIVHAEKYR
jgi:hypothetical protein